LKVSKGEQVGGWMGFGLHTTIEKETFVLIQNNRVAYNTICHFGLSWAKFKTLICYSVTGIVALVQNKKTETAVLS
jgi:hypothetical protein